MTQPSNTSDSAKESCAPTGGDDQELTVQAQINALDIQIHEAICQLQPRQEKFAYAISEGMKPVEACKQAGYSKSGASVQATRMLANPPISRTIRLLQTKYQLQHGIDIGVKRRLLLDIAESHKENQPRASVSAIAELNRMDGHVQQAIHLHKHDTKVNISYDLEMPKRKIITVDH